jgi:hypothetical protein
MGTKNFVSTFNRTGKCTLYSTDSAFWAVPTRTTLFASYWLDRRLSHMELQYNVLSMKKMISRGHQQEPIILLPTRVQTLQMWRLQRLRLHEYMPAYLLFLNYVAPHKPLEKQKRYLWCHCCKPNEMKICVFVNHLDKINYQEMCYLPPAFSFMQSLPPDKLVDIVVNIIPHKWTREMDRLDFDPVDHTVGGHTVRVKSSHGSRI